MNTNEAVPEEIEDDETVERTWRDFDDDGQLITGGGEEEWY